MQEAGQRRMCPFHVLVRVVFLHTAGENIKKKPT